MGGWCLTSLVGERWVSRVYPHTYLYLSKWPPFPCPSHSPLSTVHCTPGSSIRLPPQCSACTSIVYVYLAQIMIIYLWEESPGKMGPDKRAPLKHGIAEYGIAEYRQEVIIRKNGYTVRTLNGRSDISTFDTNEYEKTCM